MFVLYKITRKCLQLIWVGILLCEWLTVSQVEVVGCTCRPQAHSVHCVVHVSRDWRVVRHGKNHLHNKHALLTWPGSHYPISVLIPVCRPISAPSHPLPPHGRRNARAAWTQDGLSPRGYRTSTNHLPPQPNRQWYRDDERGHQCRSALEDIVLKSRSG